jgi:hypothetical protein
MNKLRPDLWLLWDMDQWFYGDVYEGIQFIGCEITNKDTICYENSIDFVRKLSSMRYEYRKRLMAIYIHLFPLYTHTKSYEYRCASFVVNDFAGYIDKYYYKMTHDVIRLLIRAAFKNNEWIIKHILDKGFNVNQLIRINGDHKTTILLYAASCERLDIVDLVLDYKPDLFMFDSAGHRGKSVIRKYLHIECHEEHKSILESITKKYYALKTRQDKHRDHNVWRTPGVY